MDEDAFKWKGIRKEFQRIVAEHVLAFAILLILGAILVLSQLLR